MDERLFGQREDELVSWTRDGRFGLDGLWDMPGRSGGKHSIYKRNR
jgi:hypothetical protein